MHWKLNKTLHQCSVKMTTQQDEMFNSTADTMFVLLSCWDVSRAVIYMALKAMHFKQSFDLKRIKRKLGFKDRPEYIAVPQVASDDDNDEIDKPPRSASPPSMVYGSSRGEHQFVLEFSLDGETSSPVLLEREPLLFDTNMSS